MKTNRLVEHFRKDFAQADTSLREAIVAGEIKPRDFRLADVFIECFGLEEYHACQLGRDNPQSVFERHGPSRVSVAEAQGAVSTAAFQNITGQIVFGMVMEAYKSEDAVFSKLIRDVPITRGMLDGERMIGLSRLGDEALVRNEADPYTLAGPGENWLFSPPLRDRGFIVPVTWEAVFQDRTGRLEEECARGGESMILNKEKRAIDAVIDENTTAHRYNWRGTVIASYGDNSGSHTWDNLVASNALVDGSDVDAAEQAFNDLVDPFTGEPIVYEAKHLIAVKALNQTVRRILNGTQLFTHVGGYPTSGNPITQQQNNPFALAYTPVTSRLLAARLATDTSWFLGDIGAAVRYMVAEPINVVKAPSLNADDFARRIVGQWRANERGQHFVVEPRAIVKSTA